MPPLVLWLIDGRAFVICAALCLSCFLWMLAGGWLKGLRRAAWWSLIIAAILPLTSTPIAWPLLLVPAVLSALGIALLATPSAARRWLRCCGALGAAVVIAGLVTELSWWPRPIVDGAEMGVVVIGDSLSAGIGAGATIWPMQLAEQTGLNVTSLAVPGARIRDGRAQLLRAPVTGCVVIILLGGNDMLSRGSAEEFHQELAALVDAVHTSGGRPLLIEFPVLPVREGYGRAMRDVASRQRVPLLHRRFLAAVLQSPSATIDGLHLSESGHCDLAQTIGTSLRLSHR